MYDDLVEPLRRADIYRSIAKTDDALCAADLRAIGAGGIDYQATLSEVCEKSYFTRTGQGQPTDHRRRLAIDGILRSQCWRAGSRLGRKRFGTERVRTEQQYEPCKRMVVYLHRYFLLA
jgi:hypothetical protein